MSLPDHDPAVCVEPSRRSHRPRAPEKRASPNPAQSSQSRPWMAPLDGAFHQPPFWHPDAVRGPSTPSLDDLVAVAEHSQMLFMNHVTERRQQSRSKDFNDYNMPLPSSRPAPR